MTASSDAPNTTTAAASAFLWIGRSAAAQVVGGGERLLVGSRNEDSAPGAGDDTTPSFPDNWLDLWKLEKPLDWEAFLKSELLKRERSNWETCTIIGRASASISILASALLIAHLLRSHQRLSTTYHRLMFGLSIADIVFSFAFALNIFMVPKEMDYIVPGAQGTVGTCTAQGFFVSVGGLLSTYYNCSICFYYLAIIKYNRSDAYIAKKLERWLHVIPITVALIYGFLVVSVKGYNTFETTCFAVPHNQAAPHCVGVKDGDTVEGFSIPCGRGNAFYNSIMYQIVFYALLSPPPVIIITTMIMMYRTVLKIERNAARYGVKTLRLHVLKERGQHAGAGSNDGANEDAPNISQKIQDCISCFFRSLRHLLTCQNNSNYNDDAADTVMKRCWMCMAARSSRRRRSIRSTRVSRKKAVLQIASGYVAAWVLYWVPFFMVIFSSSFEASIISHIFNPLQGLFNFIVFMSPKVRTARKMKRSRRGQHQTTTINTIWYKVPFDAYMSRGEGRRRP